MSTAPRIAAAKRDWGHDEAGCTVLHIDMDAFYASLEVARHPEYRGRPVIIGVGNRSVVSAASYEARQYGVNSAMASSRAQKLCPNGIFLPVDMRYYRAEKVADRVAALPYDVYDSKEARAEVEREPLSFLKIDRAETQFDESVDMYSEQVYKKAHDMLMEADRKSVV